MDFDLRTLAHARALADHGNFARAAKVLHITQPALSRSIQQLERRVGAKLFERGGGRVEPTDIGQIVLGHARELLARAENVARELAVLKGLGGGALAIGAGTYPAETFVGDAVARLVRAHPDLCLRVVVDQWANLLLWLRKGDFDVIVAEASTVAGDPELQVTALPRYQGYFVVRAGHPLLGRAPLTLRDVAAYPIVTISRLPSRVLEPLAKAQGARRGARTLPAIACDSLAVIRTIAAGSDAVAILGLKPIAADLEAKRLAVLPLVEPWLCGEFAIVRLAQRAPSRAAEAFVRMLLEMQAEIVALEAKIARQLFK